MSIEWPTLPDRRTIPKKTSKEVAQRWDSKACAWATGNVTDYEHVHLMNKAVETLIGSLSSEAKILELASGANNKGYYPPEFDFRRVFAIDISSKMIKYLRFKNPMIPAIPATIADARVSLPLKDNSFELALCFFSMRYLENQEEVIGELIRVVKPGCRVGIIDYDNYIIYVDEVRAFNASRRRDIVELTGHSAYVRRLAESSWKANPNLDFLVITKQ